MPILTINLQPKQYRKIKEAARREGFKTAAEWAHFLVEKNISLGNSPRLKPTQIILEMKKTGLYQEQFLLELKKSLEYADKTP